MVTKLNNNDIFPKYSATVLDRKIGFCEVTNYDNWIRGTLSPQYFGQDTKYKTISLSLLFNLANESQAFTKMSLFIADARNSVLQFDDLEYIYDVVLQTNSEPERLKKGSYKVDVTFKCPYARSNILNVNYTNPDINYAGNLDTPVRVEITPPSGITAVTFGPFTLTNMVAGRLYIVDGADGRVADGNGNNCYNNFNGDFLVLKPGNNKINSTLSSGIVLKYYNRYM